MKNRRNEKNDGMANCCIIYLGVFRETIKEKGGKLVHLDTFDFQAKDFYLKNGYEVFGVLEDCPKGHKRYYLKKNI